MQIQINVEFDDVCIDSVDIEPYGVVRINGWSLQGIQRVQEHLGVVGSGPLPLRAAFQTVRPDVAQARGVADERLGLLLEYATPQVPTSLSITWRGQEVAALRTPELPFDDLVVPEYAELFHQEEVWHREDVYGVGRPQASPHPEILSLARTLTGPVLDFGCGSGALVRALRDEGVEASGIELDRPEIGKSLGADVREHVTLYDGSFPLPFGDGSFGAVVATEVIEHVPDYRAAVAELFRVARREVLVTVPDMAAIPMLAHVGVVPWHLLEATHVNFFTSASLRKTLEPFARTVSMLRVCRSYVNGSLLPSSLAALASVASPAESP